MSGNEPVPAVDARPGKPDQSGIRHYVVNEAAPDSFTSNADLQA